MGLVQMFRASPCPPLLACRLLQSVLADFRDTGHNYLMFLAVSRDEARLRGQRTEAIDEAIREYALYSQIPKRWRLASFFSFDAYQRFGDALLSFWASALIQISVLERYWEDLILGLPPTNPSLLPGWHPDEEVYSTDWLDEFKPGWAMELQAVAEEDAFQPPPAGALFDVEIGGSVN